MEKLNGCDYRDDTPPAAAGEAPRTGGASPFAPGTASRAVLARLLGLPGDDLEAHVELRNLLETPQRRRGWGQAFDHRAAGRAMLALHKAGLFAGTDVVLLGGRVADTARPLLPHLPQARGSWGGDGRGGRVAWVRHPADRATCLDAMRPDWRALGLAA